MGSLVLFLFLIEIWTEIMSPISTNNRTLPTLESKIIVAESDSTIITNYQLNFFFYISIAKETFLRLYLLIIGILQIYVKMRVMFYVSTCMYNLYQTTISFEKKEAKVN